MAHFNKSPLFIQGTRHAVCHHSHGHMSIGCEVHPIAFWKKHIAGIGRKHRYTAAQVREYRLYLALVEARDAMVFPPKKTPAKKKAAAAKSK